VRTLRATAMAFVVLVAAGLLIAGTGTPGEASPPSIVVYSGQHPQLTDEIVGAFSRRTGIGVSVRTNDGIVLADQILEEGGSSPADVYLTENSPELMFLEHHALLAHVRRSTLSQVPAGDRSPTGDWVGLALRISSLAYDPHEVSRSALPSSILDLARPQWKGKVAVAPTDSDFPPLVSAVIATAGQAVAARWLTGLKRNALTYQDEEAVVAAVNRGSVAVGIANQYYWYRLQLEVGRSGMHSSLYYFAHHDVGSVENVSGAAVLASSHHRAQAQAFLAFLVSPAAQRIIASSDDFEYPVRPGVPPSAALPPLDQIAPATVPPATLGDDQMAAKLILQAGLV
jgi:iron(III) transport system substrate-binding protein